jgi:hypothetical protein
MDHPTATWKVILPSPGEAEESSPAVVWRGSEKECDDWILGRLDVEPSQAVLEYGTAGPLAPVPLPYAVIDRLRPPGEGRVVERFSDADEAAAWIRFEQKAEALRATPGDYEAVAPGGLAEALAAPALKVRRGGAVREVPCPPGAEPPRLKGQETSTVARVLATELGEVEARVFPDSHVRVSAGSLFDPSVSSAPLSLPGGAAVAFEAVVRLHGEGDRIEGRGIRYELRDASGEVVEGAPAVRSAVDHVRNAVRSAVNGLLDAHPRDRDEALERYLQSVLARVASERREIAVRTATLDRDEAKATQLLSDVRAKLATDSEEAEREAPAPGF